MNCFYNGDFLEISSEKIKDNSIDLIVTDPPYGVNFKNDFYDDSYSTIIKNIPLWYKEMYRILKEDSYLFIFAGIKTIHIWIQEAIKAGFNYKNIIATRSFNNSSFIPKNNFGFQFQPILVFSKGKGKNFNKVDFIPTSECWLNDKRNTNPNPYTYSYPNWIKTEWCFATIKRSVNNFHPNEKNVDLIKFLIEISTNENDVVADPFMGSGSAGIATMESNRNFIGIEINTNYYNLAKERINKEINIFNYQKTIDFEE